jgi:putative endonuclease
VAKHNQTGTKGESAAKKYLQENGYTILETNWRHRHLEVDIIAQQKDIVSIVEVKTRNTNYFGEPEEWVSRQKQKNLIAAANAYIEQQNIDTEIRFDIISILYKGEIEKINHIQDAFSAILR